MKCLPAFLFLCGIATLFGLELTVPRMAAPTFDGIVDAQEYSRALVINNFFLTSSARFPQEKSLVYLGHDETGLHVGAVMKSYPLNPFSNMGKEFRAQLHGENQPIWDDDSLEFRAFSKNGERFYFGFNANGATYVRIPKRFSPPKVVCSQGNGFFSAEFRLPLELLNGEWAVNFVRFEKRLKETTTTLPEKGYNLWSFQNFWTLTRGTSKTPGIRLCDLANANTGSLQLAFTGPFSGNMTVEIQGKKETRPVKIGEAGTIGIPLPAVKKGDNRFMLTLDGTQGRWSFPEYSVPSPDSQFSIAWKDPDVTMSFNEEPLASGATLQMSKSRNVLEIKSPRPMVSFQLKHGACALEEYPGVFSGAVSTVCSGEELILTAAEGKPPYIFRKEITVTPKLIAPYGMENRKLLLTPGDAYDFEINPVELGILPLDGLEFRILLPEEIEVLDVCSRIRYENGFAPYLWPPEQNMYQIVKQESRLVNGLPHKLLTIRRNVPLTKVPNMTRHYHSMRERCHLVLRCGKKDFRGEMQFFVTAKSPALAEVPRILPVEVIPGMDGVQPKKLRIFLYAQMQGNLPHPTEAALFETYKRAGINELFLETTRKIDDFTMVFFLELERYGYYRSVPDFATLMKKYPELVQKMRNGKPRYNVSLTSLADLEPKIASEVVEVFRTLKQRYPSLKKLFWDYEHNPFTGLYADYSDASLKRFIRDYSIPEKILTPDIISEKYSAQWIEYRAKELGRAVGVIRRAAKTAGYDLVMYSDYATPDCARMYGLDWKYIGSIPAAVYCGYGRNEEHIRRTRELVSPSQMIFGLLTNAGCSTWQQALILRRILDSRGGVLCWYERGAGALELKEIAAVTKVVSQCEELIADGVDCTPENLKHTLTGDALVTRKLNGEYITFLLNEENVSQRLHITFPAPARDLSTGKVYLAGKRLSLKMAPYEFAAFSWKEN